MGEKKELREENVRLRERVAKLELELDNERLHTQSEEAVADVDDSFMSADDVDLGDRGGERAMAIRTRGSDPVSKDVENIATAMNVHVEDGEHVGDALARAIDHDLKLRDHLADQLRQSRMVINRVAAILNVQKWDEDGSEIIEKAQRWSVFSHSLLARLRTAVQDREAALHGLVAGDENSSLWATAMANSREAAYADARVSELRAVIAQLVGSAEFAAMVSKMPTKAVPPSIAQIADTTTEIVPLSVSNLGTLKISGDSKSARLIEVLESIFASAVMRGEFLQILNLIFLPRLQKPR